MKKTIILIAAFFLLLIQFSCDNDLPATKKELLTSKTWVAETKLVTPPFSKGGFVISDISVMDSDEIKGYSYKYNTDGSMVIMDISNKTVFETIWSFNADETQLTYSPGIVYSYPIVGDLSLNSVDIETISESLLIFSVSYTYEEVEYTVKLTFVSK
jgi:hypothetical protein